MKTYAERLELAMKRAGLDPKNDQSELARLVGEGCKPQNIQHLLDPNKNAKSSKYTPRIATVLECDVNWLAYEDGPEPTEHKHNSAPADKSKKSQTSGIFGGLKEGVETTLDTEEGLPQPTEDEFAYVPQLDIAAACGNGRFEDHVVVKGGLAFKRSSLREFGVPEHAARIIYASGGSMHPQIQDGRVVLLNTSDKTPKEGKIYAICTPDGGLVLKRLVYDYHPAAGAMVWIMRSDNPDKTEFPDKILPPDDRTMIVGRAVWTDSVL